MAQSRKRKTAKVAGTPTTTEIPPSPRAATNGASSPTSGNGHHSHRLQATIAALAYDLYERRGRTDGRDVEDWLEAEALIQAERRRA